MNSKIQELLRTGVDPFSLKESHRVNTKVHGDYPNLHLFIYREDSDRYDPIASECRGCILDANNNWEFVCRPFGRFLNHFDPKCTFDFTAPAKRYVKHDGSLANLYWYDGAWRWATKGSPDASGNMHRDATTFYYQHINEVWDGMERPTDKNLTYTFEFKSPANRIITHAVEKPELVLLAVRNNLTGEETAPETIGAPLNWNFAAPLPYEGKGNVLGILDLEDPYVNEGYILVDGKFNRVKMKNNEYLKIASWLKQCSIRKMTAMVISGEKDEELLAEFSHAQELYTACENAVATLIDMATQKAAKIPQDLADNKSVALYIKTEGLATKIIPLGWILSAYTGRDMQDVVRRGTDASLVRKVKFILDMEDR